MPRWFVHSKPLVSWRRRWGLNTDPTEMLSGVLPTAQVDKHWDSDRLNIWGIFVQGEKLRAAGAQHICATLEAQRKELLIYKVEAWLDVNGFLHTTPIHIFTPLQNYNPHATSDAAAATSIWFPWLQSMAEQPGDPARLPEAFGLGGYNAGMQVVTINGVNFTSVGPVSSVNSWVGGGAVERGQVMWNFQDPPLRVRPFSTICVQSALAVVGGTLDWYLNVNFWFCEREDVGRVG